jgi:hypothetical protein
MTTIHATETVIPVRYQFGNGASTGLWLGFGTGRVALVGCGLVSSIVMMTIGLPVLFTVLPVLLCLCLAVTRVAGRPLLDWASPLIGHHSGTATGAGRWRMPFPDVHFGAEPQIVRLKLPGEFGRLKLIECADDPSVGLLIDSAARTVTAVFEVAGVDRFPLLEPEDRDALIAGWGQTLAVLADTDDGLTRLQVLERATHGTGARQSSGQAIRRDSNVEEDQSFHREIDALATSHTSELAVQWSFGRIDDTTLATLASRCRGVSRSLLSARLLTRPLSTSEIVREVAVAFGGAPAVDAFGSIPEPISRRVFWSHVVTDDMCHRSYAITSWPATAVTADWLAPLLLAAPDGVTRTISIHFERVAPAAAARTARTTRAKAVLDQRDRVRLGMTTSAAIDRAESTGVAMDEELAAGYRTHRLTGVVTLSGDTTDALDDAARVLRQAAAAVRIDLRPLHGQHDKALAATLPLCRVRAGGQS